MSNLNIISTSPNPAVAQQTDLVNALVTAVQAVPVTPPVVIAVPLAPASTNYTYAVVAKLGTQTVPATVTITTTTNEHTVTTPANVINGNKHILTFAATANSQLSLEAHGGIWYYANAVNAAVAS